MARTHPEKNSGVLRTRASGAPCAECLPLNLPDDSADRKDNVFRGLRGVTGILTRWVSLEWSELGIGHQYGSDPARELMDTRRHPRFRVEVEIRVYPHNSAVVRGHTVDLSESGISALLREELRVDEVVRLEFTLPLGDVEVLALVRQRNAFRYGFQFLEADAANNLIARTCGELAMQQSADNPPST